MSTFHAEVTREGPWWRVHIVELDVDVTVERRDEVTATAKHAAASQTREPAGSIDIVERSERDALRDAAVDLGFTRENTLSPRTDTFLTQGRSVVVRYDDYDCVAGVESSDQVTPFQPDRQGAVAALEFRAGPGWRV